MPEFWKNIGKYKKYPHKNDEIYEDRKQRQRQDIPLLTNLFHFMEKFHIRIGDPQYYGRNQHFGSRKNVPELAIKFKIVWKNKNGGYGTQQKTNITYDGIFEALSRYYTHTVFLMVFWRKNNIVYIAGLVFFIVGVVY